MADLNGFDAAAVEPSAGFEPIPAGQYQAVITESEMKATKDGLNEYLQITFQVIEEGEFKNRLLWSRLNIKHVTEKTRQFAQSDLSAICRAVDVMQPGDSSDLHDIPLVIKVECRKRTDNGEITNEIRGFSALAVQEKPAKAATAPWGRKK